MQNYRQLEILNSSLQCTYVLICKIIKISSTQNLRKKMNYENCIMLRSREQQGWKIDTNWRFPPPRYSGLIFFAEPGTFCQCLVKKFIPHKTWAKSGVMKTLYVKGTVSWDWDGLKLSWLDNALPVCWPHVLNIYFYFIWPCYNL